MPLEFDYRRAFEDHRTTERGGSVAAADARAAMSIIDGDASKKGLEIPKPQPGPQTEFLKCESDIIVYGGAAGGGKALHAETLIPTPSGWIAIRHLCVGDTVFAIDGQPSKVVTTSDIMYGHECYEVIFSDGSKIVADAEHLWHTQTDAERSWRSRKGPGNVRTTSEIAATTTVGKNERCNHSVPVASALKLPDVELPIHPYLLGVWLGNGNKNTGIISQFYEEVVDEIKLCGYEIHRNKQEGQWRVEGLTTLLRESELLFNKRVPRPYLRASFTQRLDLLQGLMDTDGYADPRGQCEYTTTTPQLAEDFVELVNSLGIKAVATTGRAMLNGVDCGPKWRVKFITDICVFRLPRKANRQKTSGFRGTHNNRYIIECRPFESVPVCCIGIDHPSHLYLAGVSMIPTHNTFGLFLKSVENIDKPSFRFVYFRRQQTDISKAGGPWDKTMLFFPKVGAHPNKTTYKWIFPSGAEGQLSSLQYDQDVLGWQTSELDLIMFDELTHFTEEQYWYMFSRLRSAAGIRTQVVAGTNPNGGSWVKQLIAPWVDKNWTGVVAESGEERYLAHIGGQYLWVEKEWRAPMQMLGIEPIALAKMTPEYIDLLRKPKSITFIRSSVYDNPLLLEASPGYIGNLFSQSEVEQRRLLHGDWSIMEGAFFSEWSEPRHCMSRPTERWYEWFGGLDYGKSAPFCFLLACADEKGNVIIRDEIYLRGQEPSQQALLVKAMLEEYGLSIDIPIWADPSIFPPKSRFSITAHPGKYIAEEYWDLGLRLIAANNERVNGWTRMREYLHATPPLDGGVRVEGNGGGLYVYKKCKEFIREIAIAPPKKGKEEEEGDDVDTECSDHSLDACRYLLMSRPRKAKQNAEEEKRLYTSEEIVSKAMDDITRRMNIRNGLIEKRDEHGNIEKDAGGVTIWEQTASAKRGIFRPYGR